MQSQFTPEEIRAHAVRGFRLGVPISQIAEDLRTDRANVEEALREKGLLRLPTAKLAEQAAELFRAGKSCPEIAEAMQLSIYKVQRLLPKELLEQHRNRRSEVGDEMRRRYLAGERVSEIARAMGKTVPHVCSQIRRVRVN